MHTHIRCHLMVSSAPCKLGSEMGCNPGTITKYNKFMLDQNKAFFSSWSPTVCNSAVAYTGAEIRVSSVGLCHIYGRSSFPVNHHCNPTFQPLFEKDSLLCSVKSTLLKSRNWSFKLRRFSLYRDWKLKVTIMNHHIKINPTSPGLFEKDSLLCLFKTKLLESRDWLFKFHSFSLYRG